MDNGFFSANNCSKLEQLRSFGFISFISLLLQLLERKDFRSKTCGFVLMSVSSSLAFRPELVFHPGQWEQRVPSHLFVVVLPNLWCTNLHSLVSFQACSVHITLIQACCLHTVILWCFFLACGVYIICCPLSSWGVHMAFWSVGPVVSTSSKVPSTAEVFTSPCGPSVPVVSTSSIFPSTAGVSTWPCGPLVPVMSTAMVSLQHPWCPHNLMSLQQLRCPHHLVVLQCLWCPHCLISLQQLGCQHHLVVLHYLWCPQHLVSLKHPWCSLHLMFLPCLWCSHHLVVLQRLQFPYLQVVLPSIRLSYFNSSIKTI